MRTRCLMALAIVFFTGAFTPVFSQVKPEETVKIEEIDKNFQTAKVGNLDVCYYDALKDPFEIEGFPWRDPARVFNRLPSSFTVKDVNAGALSLSNHTSGGAVRFRTDSPFIVLRANLAYSSDMNHMPRAGSAGFDLYSGSGNEIRYRKTAQPSPNMKVLEILMANGSPKKMTDWTLYLPLYGAASKIEIGLAPGSNIEKPVPHTVINPILFYGSSITQGGCASRPGNAYTTMLCRALDAPQINLGFSGSGKGETAVAEAIAGLKLSVFVMDYDHNAPSPQHLKDTHEKFFKIIRGKNPELPIIILSKCDFNGVGDKQRREIIRQTYENAVKDGDKKVWFIDGETLFGTEDRDACTVDGCHPNDLGFYRMFRQIFPVLEKAIKEGK